MAISIEDLEKQAELATKLVASLMAAGDALKNNLQDQRETKVVADAILNTLKTQNVIQKELGEAAKLKKSEEEEALKKNQGAYGLAKEYLVLQGKQLEAWHQINVETKTWYSNLTGAGTATDQVGHAFHDVEGSLNKAMGMIAQMPGGGIISFFLMGIQGRAVFDAQVNAVNMMFGQLGGTANTTKDRFLTMIEEGKAKFNLSAGELAQAVHGFVQAGVGDAQQLGKTYLGTKENVLDLSIQFDRLMQVPVGTFAKHMGDSLKNSSNTMEETTQTLIDYGKAAETAGLNQMQFLGGVMQTMEATKLYGMNIKDVAQWTLTLATNENTRMDGARKMQMAQAGVGALASGIAGLDIGMAAVLGSRMNKDKFSDEGDRKKLRGSSALDLAYMVQTGGKYDLSKDGQNELPKAVIDAFGKLVSGRDKSTQLTMAEGLGLDKQGARALVELNGAKGSKLDENKRKEYEAQLAQSMKDQANSTSRTERLLEQLKIGMVDISIGLLGAIVNGIRQLIAVTAGNIGEAQFYGKQGRKSMEGVRTGAGKLGEALGDARFMIPGLGDEYEHIDKDIKIKETLETVMRTKLAEAMKEEGLSNSKINRMKNWSLEDIERWQYYGDTNPGGVADMTRDYTPEQQKAFARARGSANASLRDEVKEVQKRNPSMQVKVDPFVQDGLIIRVERVEMPHADGTGLEVHGSGR